MIEVFSGSLPASVAKLPPHASVTHAARPNNDMRISCGLSCSRPHQLTFRCSPSEISARAKLGAHSAVHARVRRHGGGPAGLPASFSAGRIPHQQPGGLTDVRRLVLEPYQAVVLELLSARSIRYQSRHGWVRLGV